MRRSRFKPAHALRGFRGACDDAAAHLADAAAQPLFQRLQLLHDVLQRFVHFVGHHIGELLQLAEGLAQRLLGLLARGDVATHAHQADDVAVRVAEGHFVGGHPLVFARARYGLLLAADERLARADHDQLVCEISVRHLLRKDVEVSLAHQLFGAFVAEHLGVRLVVDHKPAIDVLDEDVVRQMIDQRAKLVGLAGQRVDLLLQRTSLLLQRIVALAEFFQFFIELAVGTVALLHVASPR